MSDFQSFQSIFKGDLVTPSSPDYASSISRWAINAQRNASLVSFPRTESDVAAALSYAHANSLEVAVRGGGHSSSGTSSTEGGVVIDLSRYLNEVKVDENKKLVYVGGGAVWEQVDKETIKYGLATVGGTVNHTGVGGLTCGGGYGWLSGAHGLVIDNLVQVTVVTASGATLTASTTENPDLFFGIRGGGGNFGVVTQFVFRLHPQRKTVYAGPLIFPPTVLEELVKLTQEWYLNIKKNEGMMQIFTKAPDSGRPCIVVMLFFNGSEEEGKQNFKAILNLNPIANFAKEIPFEKINSLQGEATKHGSCRVLKGIYQVKPDLPSLQKAFARCQELSASDHAVVLILEYYSLAKINSVPNGECAHVRGVGANGFVLTTWKENKVESTELARKMAREVTGIIAKGQEEYFGSNNIGYGNYDHDDDALDALTTKTEVLYGQNYGKLRELKKKYDPENVFCKWFPVVPA